MSLFFHLLLELDLLPDLPEPEQHLVRRQEVRRRNCCAARYR
jgi:hypothetical protein